MGVHISKGLVWMLRLNERLQAAVISPTFCSNAQVPVGARKTRRPIFFGGTDKLHLQREGRIEPLFPGSPPHFHNKKVFRGGVAGGLCRCGVGVVLIWNKYSESIFLASRRLTFHLKKYLYTSISVSYTHLTLPTTPYV